MTAAHYERLSQLDNSFLVYEDAQPTCAMHVASTQIHEAAPLRAADGSIDVERIERYVLSRLDRIPRYRQKLAFTPFEGHPVWIDDPAFNIRYHVRHTRIPRPGSERQLKRMVGRIFSQRLDREKPLWELWVIEGLEVDRFAILSKVHHCMIDGVSGAELIAELLTAEPQADPEPPERWKPRPAPAALGLGVGEAGRLLRAPFELGGALRDLAIDAGGVRHQLGERLSALRSLASESGLPTPLPFNRPVGPHRRVDWMPMSLEEIRGVRARLGGTVNDVVLATATGALARFLSRERGVDLAKTCVRVMTPVSVRTKEQKGALGNRVSAWTVELPVAEGDPVKRLDLLRRQTEHLKETKQALGAETLTRLGEWTGSGLLALGARLANQGTPFNTVITNVPGPRTPLYLLGSRMLEIHPHVPLAGTLGLGIALFSYDETLSCGFSADWDLVPDLHQLVIATDEAFAELRAAAAASEGRESR